MPNKITRIIDISEIDVENFEHAYKECYMELLDWYNSGENSKCIELLFKEDGTFSGHVWGSECSYDLSSLAINGDYKVSEYDMHDVEREYLSEWQEDARQAWQENYNLIGEDCKDEQY